MVRRSRQERRQDRVLAAAGMEITRPGVPSPLRLPAANAASGFAPRSMGPGIANPTQDIVQEWVSRPGADLAFASTGNGGIVAGRGQNPEANQPIQSKSPQGVSVATRRMGNSARTGNRGLAAQMWAKELDPYTLDNIPLDVLLKIRRDPVVALGLHMINAPIINADWEIVCSDPVKKAFLTAAVTQIYVEMMLTSLPSVGLGAVPLTKQWGFRAPDSLLGEETWTRHDGSVPVVIERIRQLVPGTAFPEYDTDSGVFTGIRQAGAQTGFSGGTGAQDLIPPLYALWITHGIEEVFGNPMGWPLVSNVYRLWWSKQYRLSLRDRHVEDHVSPVIIVRYPEGTFTDPDSGQQVANRSAAIQMGMAFRSGEVIAMSSSTYSNVDTELGASSGKAGEFKWNIDVRPAQENIAAFTSLEDSDDVQMLMGLLIPPQALLNAKGGLGSQAVAETMGEAFWQSQDIRKKMFDAQFNQYVVRPLDLLNFPPDSPRARLVTTGFAKRDRALIGDLLKALAARPDVRLPAWLDIPAMTRARGVPTQQEMDDSIYVSPPAPPEQQRAAEVSKLTQSKQRDTISTQQAHVTLQDSQEQVRQKQLMNQQAADAVVAQQAATQRQNADAATAQAIAEAMATHPDVASEVAKALLSDPTAAGSIQQALLANPTIAAVIQQSQQATTTTTSVKPTPPVPGASSPSDTPPPSGSDPAGTQEQVVIHELRQLATETERLQALKDRQVAQGTHP